VMSRPRVLLADDHAFILAGITSLLASHYDLVGEVNDGRAAVESTLRMRPDVTVLDITMPLLNGIDAARQIKKEWPQAKLLFLSMHASPVYLREAIDAGATGYVLKSSATEELRTAIQRVLKGQVYLPASFDPDVLQAAYASVRSSRKSSVRLTARQREVIQLITEGCANKEIAAILKISVKTVEFHRGRIMNKLGLHNLADLIRWAVQSGMVSD